MTLAVLQGKQTCETANLDKAHHYTMFNLLTIDLRKSNMNVLAEAEYLSFLSTDYRLKLSQHYSHDHVYPMFVQTLSSLNENMQRQCQFQLIFVALTLAYNQ